MDASSLLMLFAFGGASFGAASTGAIFRPGEWYRRLDKPRWRPPDWLFAPVWTLLYAMIALSGWLVWREKGLADAAVPLTAYAVQLVLNAAWTPIFFGLRRPGLAAIEIAMLWASIVATIFVLLSRQPRRGRSARPVSGLGELRRGAQYLHLAAQPSAAGREGRPMTPGLVEVNDRMQRGYRYALVAPAGRAFHPDFRPDLTPADMLALGVFGGKYMTDCRGEFPASWFAAAKLSPERRDPSLNWFGVDASQPLSVWRAKGWIHPDDPRGWFQWYCRYYQGRRMAGEDERQIGRWKAMRRHLAQLRRACEPGDRWCRPRQRQALLHWAYDSRSL